MRVAVDTNVIVSALATRGLCSDLFQAVLAEHDLIVGETVFAELRTVLRKKLRLPGATIDTLETFLRRQAIVVAAEAPAASHQLDQVDAAVIAEGAAGDADVFVTGDHGILDAKDLPLKTVSPRQLWELIRRAP